MSKNFKYGITSRRRTQYCRCAIIDITRAPKYRHGGVQSLFNSATASEESAPQSPILVCIAPRC
ncbi:hypothetical protein IEQ34_008403 [Dendrobium chrysotoxum]|uniref:Uncharacterized protein n=1 Tax=Dendrobium chrysotoxum TaxID=161865 RepID=A0AAV7GYT8_DENCH|nr:hypothetical protein IEQ34_008403 [Dendrobium chrysotoxum]